MTVPMKGNSEAAVAQPTRKGSAMRRRASLNVKTIRAIQIATSPSTAKVTTRFKVVFVIPKIARDMRELKEHPSE